MSLAVFPITGPSLPRVTFLTREFIHRQLIRVGSYLFDQSGGRVALEFRVFDWFTVPISTEEWDRLEWRLGEVVSPLVAQAFQVDVSLFSHVAFVIDQHNAGGAAWNAENRRFLHLGAKDLTPALWAHELGHMFGATHARREEPLGAQEYGDAFCVMGAEGAKLSFADPGLSFRTEFGEPQWRFCTQCNGLFFNGDAVLKGTCAGAAIPGTGHAAMGHDFVLRHGPAAASEQADWRRCARCFLLFLASDANPGGCPAGAAHQPVPGGLNYALARDVPPGPGQPQWRRCRFCQSMFYDGTSAKGVCAGDLTPAQPGHEAVQPGSEYAIAHSVGDYNVSGPGMVASTLLGCGWLNVARHGVDVGPALRSRPAQTRVRLRPLRGAPPDDEVGLPVVAFADGLATERLLIEWRTGDGWDRAMPNAAPAGVTGWVLVHVTAGVHPRVSSLLVGEVPARAGASMFIPDAFLTVTVVAVDAAANTVDLRLRSDAWSAFGALQDKRTLAEFSDHRPAIASDGTRLFLAWTGTDERINLMVSGDDGATFHKHTTGELTGHSPALASSTLTFVAWTGTNGALNVAEVDRSEPLPATIFGLRNKVTLAETSPHGPGLARGGDGRLYLVWTGEDDRINLVRSGDGGLTWTEKVTYRETSSHGPAIVAHPNGRMYLAWKGVDNDNLNVARLNLQVTPQEVAKLERKTTLPELSEHGPALGAHDDFTFLGWTGTDDRVNLARPVGETAGYAARVHPEFSQTGPSLTSHRDRLWVAWRGLDNLHLNTATLRRRLRLLDDFSTGTDGFLVDASATLKRLQRGTMIGGSRMVRVANGAGGPATVNLAPGSLRLTLRANQTADLEIGYGWATVDDAGPGLLLNLLEGGADRLRVHLSSIHAKGANVTAVVFTRHKLAVASAFVRAGPVEFRFADFGTDLQDFTEVTHLHVRVQVVESYDGAIAPNFPTLRIEGIEAAGQGEL